MIYYYFRDKGGLYRTLLEESFRELGERLQQQLAGVSDPTVRLEVFIEIYIRHLLAKRRMARIMHRELAQDSPFIATLTQKYVARNFMLLNRSLEEGEAQGALRPGDRPLTAVTLVAMMAFYFFAFPIISRLLEIPDYDEAFAERLIEHTKKLFFHGVLNPDRHKEKF